MRRLRTRPIGKQPRGSLESALPSGSEPLVSIVMVSYNQRDFVEQALESALSQAYENLQVVISDDASTDGTDAVIASVARRHPGRVVPILNTVNVGVARNCNTALERCTGDYIAFLGGDDIFLPGKISSQVAWLEERRERVLCGHQVEVFYEDGSPPHPFQHILRAGKGASKVIRYGAFAACSIMVRADSIPPRGFEESLPIVSDYMLWVEVLAGGGEFGYVPGTYARYRRHSSNISSNVPCLVEDAQRALDLIALRYPQYAESCRRAYGRFVHFPLGGHLLAQGKKRKSREALLKAVRLEPSFLRPWLQLLKTIR